MHHLILKIILKEKMAIRIKYRHVVKPAEETPIGKFPLSELDQVGIITHSYHLHLYNRPTQDHWLVPSENNVINTLKDSLSRALVSFYPLAGRLTPSRGGRFELECNAMGAELIDAESDKNLSALGDFHSSGTVIRDLLPEIDYDRKPIRELPVLAVQVTRFKCGGLSFGMSISHVVVDGRSAFHFTKEWARLALGQPLEVAPFLDRRILRARFEEAKTAASDDDHQLVNFTYTELLRVAEAQGVEFGNKVTPTFVSFTKDEIDKLKQIANLKNGDDGDHDDEHRRRPYSRFEVIAGYVWKCVTKARELKRNQVTSLIACVDSRGRLEPPLPSSYFGNAIVDVEASSEAGELISKPLSYACSKVRDAIPKVNSEFVFENIEFYKTETSLAKYQYFDDRGKIQGPSYGNHNIMVISWLNLPNPGVDFGWGKDIHTGPTVVHACDGDAMIYPPTKDGSLVVGVVLQPKEKLLQCLSCQVD